MFTKLLIFYKVSKFSYVFFNSVLDNFVKPQVEFPHQEFCRHLICRRDTDMDRTHYHIAFCPIQTADYIQMELLKSRIIVKAQHIYKNRPVSMDKQTVHTTA